ncbi:hypothetical protein QQ008_24760 [Fulvivirgaceae bacterium BMA10]|uniref:Uncharacterized protein n=1 Tax=Splendidivirga corallicola TaxID=3051826 RepID=A0ABT8KV17_9BACT|nr:hypothetical protein [Fulvivirgaceae bacterium BMA10]
MKDLANLCITNYPPIDVKKLVEPGGVATDFGGRSLDFQHNETLTEYNEFVSGVMNTFQNMIKEENMSTPEQIADVIFQAATDESDQLRYRAGADAEQLLTARSQMEDAEFIDMMKQNLQLN